jgi:hypothetical protein
MEFNALVHAKALLTNPVGSVQEFVVQADMIHAGLFNQSPDLFPGTSISFAHLNQLIVRLLTPVQEPKFGLFGTKEVDVTDSPIRQVPLDNISFLTMDTAPNAEPEVVVDSVEQITETLEKTDLQEKPKGKRRKKFFRKGPRVAVENKL